MADPTEPPRRLPEQSSNAPNYTQVNILFPVTNVELPPAETFKAFPPEAQKALLDAFKIEQMQRHAWLRHQQTNDHELNKGTQRNHFRERMAGLTCATLLTLAILATGGYLVSIGASILGFTMLITAIAGLIGTAVWGHRAGSSQEGNSQEETTELQETVPPRSEPERIER